MKRGWLWYDSDPKKSLDAKLTEAALRYKEKFGMEPTVCYINPAHLDSKESARGSLKVISTSAVSPNYLWLELEK